MKSRRITALALCALLCAACAGCGGGSSDSQNTAANTAMAAESQAADAESSASVSKEGNVQADTMMGIVRSIDTENNQITIALMNMSNFGGFRFSGEMPGDLETNENGEIEVPEEFSGDRPENMPSGDFQPGQNGEMPEGFNGEGPENMPSGEIPENFDGERPENMPSGDFQPGSEDIEAKMQESMEEYIYMISDTSELKDKDGNAIALKDLADGDYVQFSAAEGYVISLNVMDASAMGEKFAVPMGNGEEADTDKA